MAADIAILVPVLHRPQNIGPLLRSLQTSVLPYRLLFLCSPHDREQQQALKAAAQEYSVVPWDPGPADWAKKLEHGRGLTSEPLMLLAADDLRFHQGWDVELRNAWRDFDVGVLGTQDLGNRLVIQGQHSTHPCVVRDYADCHGTIDDPKLMLHQGYDHQYCDNELCETAMSRGCWKFLHACVIEHLHPSWGKGTGDSTYLKGNRHWQRDLKLFKRRKRLWSYNRHGIRRLPT